MVTSENPSTLINAPLALKQIISESVCNFTATQIANENNCNKIKDLIVLLFAHYIV